MAKKIIGANIVQACRMVFMRVCKQNSIKRFIIYAQHLVPEIWRGIHNQGCCGRLNKNAAAQAFVSRVGAGANITIAGYHRYAGACAGAKKCYGELGKHCNKNYTNFNELTQATNVTSQKLCVISLSVCFVVWCRLSQLLIVRQPIARNLFAREQLANRDLSH